MENLKRKFVQLASTTIRFGLLVYREMGVYKQPQWSINWGPIRSVHVATIVANRFSRNSDSVEIKTDQSVYKNPGVLVEPRKHRTHLCLFAIQQGVERNARRLFSRVRGSN